MEGPESGDYEGESDVDDDDLIPEIILDPTSTNIPRAKVDDPQFFSAPINFSQRKPHDNVYSHSSAFDLDIDLLEDKPWRKPGVDITDYFNYGFTEDTWREYCARQHTLRQENAAPSKIAVYDGDERKKQEGQEDRQTGFRKHNFVPHQDPRMFQRRKPMNEEETVISLAGDDFEEEGKPYSVNNMNQNNNNEHFTGPRRMNYMNQEQHFTPNFRHLPHKNIFNFPRMYDMNHQNRPPNTEHHLNMPENDEWLDRREFKPPLSRDFREEYTIQRDDRPERREDYTLQRDDRDRKKLHERDIRDRGRDYEYRELEQRKLKLDRERGERIREEKEKERERLERMRGERGDRDRDRDRDREHEYRERENRIREEKERDRDRDRMRGERDRGRDKDPRDK